MGFRTNGERQFWQKEQQMQRHRGMRDGGEFGGNVCREGGRAGAQGHATGCRGGMTKGDSNSLSRRATTAMLKCPG